MVNEKKIFKIVEVKVKVLWGEVFGIFFIKKYFFWWKKEIVRYFLNCFMVVVLFD